MSTSPPSHPGSSLGVFRWIRSQSQGHPGGVGVSAIAVALTGSAKIVESRTTQRPPEATFEPLPQTDRQIYRLRRDGKGRFLPPEVKVTYLPEPEGTTQTALAPQLDPDPLAGSGLAELKRTGDDAADAMTARAEWLKRVYPAQYACFVNAQHPVAKKRMFSRTFALVTSLANGYPLPDEALRPTCEPRERGENLTQAVVTRIGKEVLEQAKRAARDLILRPMKADILADGLFLKAAQGVRDTDRPTTDPETRLRAAAALVTAFVSDDPDVSARVGASFLSAPPLVQAKQFMTASLNVVTKRYPMTAPFVLAEIDAAEGFSYWFRLKRMRGENDPDYLNWSKYSETQRAGVVMRELVDKFQLGIKAADDQAAMDAFAMAMFDRLPRLGTPEARELVESVFLPNVVANYDDALRGGTKPPEGYSAEEILNAAFILRSGLPQMAVILQR